MKIDYHWEAAKEIDALDEPARRVFERVEQLIGEAPDTAGTPFDVDNVRYHRAEGSAPRTWRPTVSVEYRWSERKEVQRVRIVRVLVVESRRADEDRRIRRATGTSEAPPLDLSLFAPA